MMIDKGREIELQNDITRVNLRILMTSFYKKALDDEELAPFFIDEISDDLSDDDWDHHIELLADFWLHKMLGEDTYYGNFVGAHVKMTHITQGNFAQWVKLFSQTADEVYTPDIAELFKQKAVKFSNQFKTSKKKI